MASISCINFQLLSACAHKSYNWCVHLSLYYVSKFTAKIIIVHFLVIYLNDVNVWYAWCINVLFSKIFFSWKFLNGTFKSWSTCKIILTYLTFTRGKLANIYVALIMCNNSFFFRCSTCNSILHRPQHILNLFFIICVVEWCHSFHLFNWTQNTMLHMCYFLLRFLISVIIL